VRRTAPLASPPPRADQLARCNCAVRGRLPATRSVLRRCRLLPPAGSAGGLRRWPFVQENPVRGAPSAPGQESEIRIQVSAIPGPDPSCRF